MKTFGHDVKKAQKEFGKLNDLAWKAKQKAIAGKDELAKAVRRVKLEIAERPVIRHYQWDTQYKALDCMSLNIEKLRYAYRGFRMTQEQQDAQEMRLALSKDYIALMKLILKADTAIINVFPVETLIKFYDLKINKLQD